MTGPDQPSPLGDDERSDNPADVTQILSDLSGGQAKARDELFDAVYARLRALAENKLYAERRGHTLQPTALVHEAYMKLVDQSRVTWKSRTHFYAVAAQAMRRVLIDSARHKKREKRGGGWQRVTLDDAFNESDDHDVDLDSLKEALQKMETLDPRQARVVELRLFGGLSADDTADLLDISTRTVDRDWKMGQAWLRKELGHEE